MNPVSNRRDIDSDEAFDRQARQLHAAALASVSPQTLMKLRGARHATAPARRGHGWRWLAATACSALLAVAIGVQFVPHQATAPVVATAVDADDAEDYAAALSENPDLYLWLVSDGQSLAME